MVNRSALRYFIFIGYEGEKKLVEKIKKMEREM